MPRRVFNELHAAQEAEGKFICVGLDSDYKRIPEIVKREREAGASIGDVIADFNSDIVEATFVSAAAYKLNFGFYVARMEERIRALRETIQNINLVAPGLPVILDAKWGDIENTNQQYAEFAFDDLGVDAITVNPYLGYESLLPFLERIDKGVFVLCRTSNPGADEFQDLTLRLRLNPLYLQVAKRVETVWNKNKNCGLVVGATCPDEMKKVREVAPTLPILIPGVGAQGGDLEKSLEAGLDQNNRGVLVNSSRGIIFASSGYDYVAAASREAEKLHNAINQYRKERKNDTSDRRAQNP